MSTKTILIADDDTGLLRLLRHALEPLGVGVREARDAMSALTQIHANPPDLVILDINMPGGNGLSACEMLASDPQMARLAVIILTGKSDDSTRFRCQKMGAHHVLKGADAIERVKALVRRLLHVSPDSAAVQTEQFVG